MSAMTPCAKDDPLLLAFNAWKETNDYENTRRWALVEEHVSGSLWEAFTQGWNSRQLSRPADPTPDEPGEVAWLKAMLELVIAAADNHPQHLIAPNILEIARSFAGKNEKVVRAILEYQDNENVFFHRTGSASWGVTRSALVAFTMTIKAEIDGADKCPAKPIDPTPQQTREEEAERLMRHLYPGASFADLRSTRIKWLAVRDEAARLFGDAALRRQNEVMRKALSNVVEVGFDDESEEAAIAHAALAECEAVLEDGK